MYDFTAFDSSSIVSSYNKISSKYGYSKDKLRQELAEANNCIAIGDTSCYADMVAVPKDYPNIVIKICPSHDKFITYAKCCLSGEISGPHIPKIYSGTEINDGAWLFVMERLERPLSEEEKERIIDCACFDWSNSIPTRGKYAKVCKAIKETKENICSVMDTTDDCWCFDLHYGNFMCRKDGTIVFLDPVC